MQRQHPFYQAKKCLIFLLYLLFLPSLSAAQPTTRVLDGETIAASLDRIEAGMQREFSLQHNLEDYLEKLPLYGTWADRCVDKSEAEIALIDNELGMLGGATLDEPSESRNVRNTLLEKKAQLTNQLTRCRTLLIRSNSASREIGEYRIKELEERSLERGINVFTALRESTADSNRWLRELGTVLLSEQGIKALERDEKLKLLMVAVFGVLFGLAIRQGLSRWHTAGLQRWQKQLDAMDSGIRILAALAMTLRRYVVQICTTLFVGLYIHANTLDVVPKPLLTIVMDGLPLLFVVFAITYLIYHALRVLGLRTDFEEGVAKPLQRRLNILAIILFIGYLLTQTILANSLPDAALFLVRAIVGTVVVTNLIWILWRTHASRGPRFGKSIRIVSSILLVGALIAEFAGFRALSGGLLRGVVGTLFAYGLFRLLHVLLAQFLNDLDEGKSQWQKKFRQVIGVHDSANLPGYLWIKLISAVAVWFGFFVTLLWVWQVPEADIQATSTKLTHGFTVGTIEIVPAKIFESIIVLILLLTLNSWFQRVLDRSWLESTRIDRGARESILTISNYIGIGVAIIVALAVAGLDFSRLALIAGALSVGIGFGMQNIVNNFVSGLILLFERPIKTGDWIVANGVEGRVKRISIRSTEIESFDRADIIVPNSLLISDNLTNWVHKSHHGRLRIPVSVAYGSNTELVKKLLDGIARENREVIIGHPKMHDPKVLFLAFGESSLDFELRFFVRNIEKRLDITSDMNFAIDRQFREHEIEIPFPQRDIHIRSGDEETKLDAQADLESPPEKQE